MRGLESLIPHKRDDEPQPHSKDSVFLIETEQIKPNPYQPRREFDETELKSLADSIKTYGVLQPLLVTKVESDVPSGRKVEYELIAGERRWRASQMANLPRVPVIVKKSTNKEKLEVSLIENIQRDDLNALDEALAFKQLQDEFNLKQTEIAQRVGKSTPYVANTLRVLSLPDNIKKALASNEISEGHTRPLLSLKEEQQQTKLFEEIKKQGMNVREAEKRARELGAKTYKNTPQPSRGRAKLDPEILELVDKFKNTHSLSNVRVKTKGRKAHLAVEFTSKKDLSKWLKRLLP